MILELTIATLHDIMKYESYINNWTSKSYKISHKLNESVVLIWGSVYTTVPSMARKSAKSTCPLQ